MTNKVSLRGLGLAATNLLLAFVYALFAYAHVRLFLEQPRLSLVLIVGMETLLVVFIIVRKDPDKTWHSWQTWLTSTGGTLFPLLLRPTAVPDDLLLGQILQIFGVMLQIWALISLNKSFGILPAYRGVKSDGLYRFVRHPLYAAYEIALAGYLINNLSIYNAVVIVVGTAFQVMRIQNEERLLLEYPDYIVFADKTKWRLSPFIW